MPTKVDVEERDGPLTTVGESQDSTDADMSLSEGTVPADEPAHDGKWLADDEHDGDSPADDVGVADGDSTDLESNVAKRRFKASSSVNFVLPALVVLLMLAAGILQWQHLSTRNANTARVASVQAAKDSTVAILSYKAETAEQQLGAARDLLTGQFRDSYTGLINDVVIPGAQQQQISSVANVTAAASVSATPDHAVVLVFVNQTMIVGSGAPTGTSSMVQVTLERSDDRWLVSAFDPV